MVCSQDTTTERTEVEPDSTTGITTQTTQALVHSMRDIVPENRRRTRRRSRTTHTRSSRLCPQDATGVTEADGVECLDRDLVPRATGQVGQEVVSHVGGKGLFDRRSFGRSHTKHESCVFCVSCAKSEMRSCCSLHKKDD